jgi:hypothetical protein
MRRTKQEWLQLAEVRIGNILGAYGCCPIRMLEAKISEAGPGNKRPNPLSLSQALSRMVSNGSVVQLAKRTAKETPFYALAASDRSSAKFDTLVATRRHLYLLHKSLTERNEYCSDVLEEIIDKALVRAGVSTFLSRFRNQTQPSKRPLDFVVELGGVRFGGEAKNYREWLYPDSAEIWEAISKCCEIDAVPVLITRKLPYVTYLLFRAVGMIAIRPIFSIFTRS